MSDLYEAFIGALIVIATVLQIVAYISGWEDKRFEHHLKIRIIYILFFQFYYVGYFLKAISKTKLVSSVWAFLNKDWDK